MKKIVSFFVEGVPVAKARPRLGRHGVYTPTKTKVWERIVQVSAIESKRVKLITTPIEARLTFYMPMPKTKAIQRKIQDGIHQKRPDLDNLIKSILDPLNNLIYKDDALVYSITAEKIYGFGKVGVDVKLWY